MSLQSTDPIADLLTRIRNAALVGKTEVRVPTSKLKNFERFFDVNMLTLLSLWFMVKAEQHRYALPLVACLTAGWLFLLALRARPAWRRHLERLPLYQIGRASCRERV